MKNIGNVAWKTLEDVERRWKTQVALDMWIARVMQPAYRLPATPTCLNAFIGLRSSMDSSHAAMLYMSCAARARTGGDKIVAARAMRHISIRCVNREIGFSKVALFKDKLREMCGEYLEHDKNLFSQMRVAHCQNVRNAAVPRCVCDWDFCSCEIICRSGSVALRKMPR